MENNKSKKTLRIVGSLIFLTGLILLFVGMAVAFTSNPFENNAFPILLAIGGVLFFVGAIIISFSVTSSAFKKIKSLGSEMLGTENSESDSFIDMVKKSIKKQRENEIKAHTCDYCGGSLKDGETKCPNCGAQKIYKDN